MRTKPRPGAALVVLGGTAVLLAGGSSHAQAPLPRFKPSFEERANFAEMSASARRAMLRAVADGLAGRLADAPDDVEAWLRLAQARMALGERAAAVEAYERAVALRPESPSVLRAYAQSLLDRPDPVTGAPRVGEAAAALYRRLAVLAPGDPEPHRYLGFAALQAGAPQQAAQHWRRVLELLDPDDPERPLLEVRLERIASGPAVSEPQSLFWYP